MAGNRRSLEVPAEVNERELVLGLQRGVYAETEVHPEAHLPVDPGSVIKVAVACAKSAHLVGSQSGSRRGDGEFCVAQAHHGAEVPLGVEETKAASHGRGLEASRQGVCRDRSVTCGGAYPRGQVVVGIKPNSRWIWVAEEADVESEFLSATTARVGRKGGAGSEDPREDTEEDEFAKVFHEDRFGMELVFLKSE